MTDEQLQELERLEQAATPGPWESGPDAGAIILPLNYVNGDMAGMAMCVFDADGKGAAIAYTVARADDATVRMLQSEGKTLEDEEDRALNDMNLIIAARNALPELLAEVRRLQACREALRLCLAEYVEEYGSASCDCEEPDCWVRKSVEALKATE